MEISRLVPDDNKEEEAEESPEKPHFTVLLDISMFGHRLSTQLFSFTSSNSEQLVCNTKFFALHLITRLLLPPLRVHNVSLDKRFEPRGRILGRNSSLLITVIPPPPQHKWFETANWFVMYALHGNLKSENSVNNAKKP